MTHPTFMLRSVIEQLTTEGYLSEEQQTQIASSAVISIVEETTPWYMQALVAIGAWLAAICFLAAVLLSFVFTISSLGATAFNAIILILGVVITLAGIGLRRATTESIFMINLTLALSLLGQILTLGGIWLMTERIPLTALATIGIQIANSSTQIGCNAS